MTQWTDKQLDVINTRNRNILVSAAAGSGKTAVLVERIIKLITDKKNPVDIDQLLVVTFTRAAASEMKERVREALEKISQENPEDVNIQKQLTFIHNAHISTIDSFCGSVVKDNFDKIDLDPNFRIADEIEVEMLKTDVIEEMLEEYYEQGDSDFMELAQQYSGGKVSDNIGKLISRLYRLASINHNPKSWVQNCINAYQAQSLEEFSDAQWMKQLITMVKNQMESWISSLTFAMDLSESEDGPKYGKGLQKLIDGLEAAVSSNTFEEIRKGIFEIPSVRLSGVRDCDENKKRQVGNIKTDVVKNINELKKGIFSHSLEDIYNDVKKSGESVKTIIRLTLDFMERFEKQKAEKGIMDFDDQAHFALRILNDEDENGKLIPSQTARQMAAEFQEIMIDEYQDSNPVQEAILSAISRGQGINNMFMVGDVKQSIYRFRQADPKLFIRKYDNYKEDLQSDNCKIILDKNFRSRKEIIESVNYIFDFIMHREVGGIDYKNGNQLTLGADYEEPPKNQDNSTEFIMIEGDEKKIEAEYVAQKIKEITDPVTGMKITQKGEGLRPVKYSDIVILLRSMKGNAEIYVEQLENNGIPAYAKSREGYYQAMEVRTIINMLSIIDNPRQDIPLAATMVSPMFAFESDELAVIKSENQCENFYDNLMLYVENGSDRRLVKKTKEFLDAVNTYRKMVPYTSVYEMINRILSDTGYDYYILSMPNGKKRYLNIQALKEKAVAYDAISYKGLFNFIRYVEKIQYLSEDEGEASTVSENDNIVQIMSIHKSKGLQYPVVFLCNTNGKFRADTEQIVADDDGNIGVDYIDTELRIKDSTIIKDTIKMKNKEEDMAETLRILYVALTRAKEKLFITGVAKDIEKVADAFAGCRYDKSTVMSYDGIVSGKSLMDWMGRTIGRNKAFDSITGEHEYNPESKNSTYDKESCIIVKKIAQDEIIFQELQNDVTDEIKKETLELFEKVEPQKNDVRSAIEAKFTFKYPYEESINMYSKASVTEIKKQSMTYEEEQDGFAVYGEKPEQEATVMSEEDYEELPEIIPDFMKKIDRQEQGLTGAKRGTAYHRVFELLDMESEEYTDISVSKMIERFVETGMLDQEEAECVDVRDVVRFTETELFQRMKSAHARKELFRERKFLMGVPANLVKPNIESDETVIIQGIIDVCFIEDGKYVIVDYKTDKVQTLKELAERYHVQLECYKQAISQISEMEVKDMIIYSVTLGDEITL